MKMMTKHNELLRKITNELVLVKNFLVYFVHLLTSIPDRTAPTNPAGIRSDRPSKNCETLRTNVLFIRDLEVPTFSLAA